MRVLQSSFLVFLSLFLSFASLNDGSAFAQTRDLREVETQLRSNLESQCQNAAGAVRIDTFACVAFTKKEYAKHHLALNPDKSFVNKSQPLERGDRLKELDSFLHDGSADIYRYETYYQMSVDVEEGSVAQIRYTARDHYDADLNHVKEFEDDENRLLVLRQK